MIRVRKDVHAPVAAAQEHVLVLHVAAVENFLEDCLSVNLAGRHLTLLKQTLIPPLPQIELHLVHAGPRLPGTITARPSLLKGVPKLIQRRPLLPRTQRRGIDARLPLDLVATLLTLLDRALSTLLRMLLFGHGVRLRAEGRLLI